VDDRKQRPTVELAGAEVIWHPENRERERTLKTSLIDKAEDHNLIARPYKC